jgi:hypothetical protein
VVRSQDQIGEDQAALRTTQLNRAPFLQHLQRPQDVELDASEERRSSLAGGGDRRRDDGIQTDGARDPLQPDRAAILEQQPLHGPGDVRELGRDEDLPRSSPSAKPRRHVERTPTEPAIHGDRFTRVDPDPREEGQFRRRLALQGVSERYRGHDRLPWGVEHGKHLVPSDLQDLAGASRDGFASERQEARGEPCCGCVAPRVAEARVAAEIGYQEGAHGGGGPAIVGSGFRQRPSHAIPFRLGGAPLSPGSGGRRQAGFRRARIRRKDELC